MQRFVPTVLSMLVIAVASPSVVKAQSMPVDSSALNPVVTANPAVSQLTPFDLSFLAYRGYLQDQGIPGGQLLVSELEAGTVSAKDVVQAAIKAHRLPEQMLTDQSYSQALESQLKSFSED